MQDKNLFAKTFKKSLLGRDSWVNWKVFLSVLFGLPLTPKQREICYQFTKRKDLPQKAFRECFLICGRRAGKSLIASLVAVFVACFIDHSDSLVGGETGVVMILSSDRQQAKVIFSYVRALLQVPLLKGLIVSERKEGIDLSNGVTIMIQTASYRSVRGFTVLCAICDEICFWQDFDRGGANPDNAVLQALRPAMLTVPKSLLFCVSSPYGQTGAAWTAYNRYFGQVSDTLIWQSPSLLMNPCLPRAEVERAYKADPISADAEYGANFREASNEFISLAAVAARTSEGVTERPYRDDHRYYAFLDSSGGRGDSACLCIGHYEAKRAVQDVLREIPAPHSPQHACAEFAAILKGFHVHEVFGDRFAASFVQEYLERAGISYRGSEFSRSQLYIQLLPNLTSGTIVLLDNEKMAAQFAGLVRSPGRNADAVDHRSGAHDDCSNATAGCLVEILRDNQEGQLGLLMFEQEISGGKRRDPSQAPPRKAVVVRQEPSQRRPGPCEACGSTSCSWVPGGRAGRPYSVLCNQCQAVDGVVPLPFTTCKPDCPGFLPQHVSGMVRCGNCGNQTRAGGGAPQPTNGATFRDLKAPQRGPFYGVFDGLRHR
jgi:hypothetical protein